MVTENCFPIRSSSDFSRFWQISDKSRCCSAGKILKLPLETSRVDMECWHSETRHQFLHVNMFPSQSLLFMNSFLESSEMILWDSREIFLARSDNLIWGIVSPAKVRIESPFLRPPRQLDLGSFIVMSKPYNRGLINILQVFIDAFHVFSFTFSTHLLTKPSHNLLPWFHIFLPPRLFSSEYYRGNFKQNLQVFPSS